MVGPKGISLLAGVFLVAVWVGGLAVHAQPWITWLSLVAGVLVLGGASRGGAALSILVAIGLLLMWIGGLTTHAQNWISWCAFVAACALILDSIVGDTDARRPISSRRGKMV